MHVPSLHIPRSRAGPGNELEDDTARVCDLEKALAPLLRLDWRRNRDFLAEQPGVFDVDVIDDENDEKTVGTVSGSGGRLERRKADTEEDRLKPAFGWAKDTNPSAAISSSKPKWRLANSAEAAGSSTLSEIVDAVICIGRIRLILTPALAAPRVRGRSHLLDVERPQRDEDREHGDHLEPGQGSSPYYEYEEEWLLVVEATLVLRASDLEHTLERGDLVRFPPGSAGAHKLMNRSEFPARTLMFSSSRVPAVAVYPDSDKIDVFPCNEVDELFFERSTAVRGRRARRAGTKQTDEDDHRRCRCPDPGCEHYRGLRIRPRLRRR
jgi:uncharacterized cupin superfamily protein